MITLSIIGVVAAMTLPSLIQKNVEKTTVAQLKKTYSAMSQAYLSILSEEGSPDTWGLADKMTEGGGKVLMDRFAKYLKIIKNCGTTEKGCYSEGSSDTQGNTAAKAVLGDGSAISLKVWNQACGASYGGIKQLQGMCAILEVDVNGLKKPNKQGQDIFRFFITKTSIYPYGTAMQEDQSTENTEDNLTFEHCARHKGDSLGCTAWVLYNENMEYLRCSDLSWDGKKTCKK